MKNNTVYGNCFEEYIMLSQTPGTIKLTFTANCSGSVKEFILKAIARAIEEDTGFSYECGAVIDWEASDED